MWNCYISSPSNNLTMLASVARASAKGKIGECDISEFQDQAVDTFLIWNQLGVSGLPFSFNLGDDQQGISKDAQVIGAKL